MTLKEELKGSLVFRDLTDEEIEKIVPLCKEEQHPAGTELYKEGDFANKLYIVIKGKTALDLKNTMAPYDPPSRMIVDMIGPGETMGWSALVEPHIYTLSCKCAEDCSLISVSGPGLMDVMNRECHVGLKVMTAISKIIATRLTHTRVLFIGERGLQSVNNY
jgi:CRP-like cAMP-binding protein